MGKDQLTEKEWKFINRAEEVTTNLRLPYLLMFFLFPVLGLWHIYRMFFGCKLSFPSGCVSTAQYCSVMAWGDFWWQFFLFLYILNDWHCCKNF
jgi:hypothetical protein